MDLSRYDHLETYCGMLGHQVPFSYCRRPGSEVPCSRINGCWAGMIPARQLNGPSAVRKSRMEMILQALDLARSR